MRCSSRTPQNRPVSQLARAERMYAAGLLLAFYIEDSEAWQAACERMIAAGFVDVISFNPCWNLSGRTFEDVDGYRVVLQNSGWSA